MLGSCVMSNPSNPNLNSRRADLDEEQLNNISVSQEKISKPLDQGSSGMGQPGSHSSNNYKVTGHLTSAQVRWFYKEPNSQWTPFGGFDTLIAEDAFRKLPPDLKIPKKYAVSLENPSSTQERENEPKVEAEYASPSLKVQVLGGLYELDLLRRKISSVYWPGEVFECTRGTWFYGSWEPLDEVTADLIEQEHLKHFEGKTSSDFASTLKPIYAHTFVDFNVDWYSPTEVYFYSNRTPTQLMKSFTQKLGLQKSTGTRIFRAFKTLATEGDRRKDISHLVFVVHGVGQIMNMNIGDRVFGNTCAIRERVTAMKEEYFPESNQYVEFFPVEWRSKVVLDDGLVECITPPNIKYVREFINTSAMDIMYYMSPVYCGEIQDCVANEMNRLYTMFHERNPNLKPKVSVIAHSLGAVIVYDIVSGYLPQGFAMAESAVPGASRLKFGLDNVFCFGSPLSVFLAMRAKKGDHGSDLFPSSLCNRLYNIYHITDPIAYRLEPLVHADYCKVAPIPIQNHSCVTPKRYSEMPLELEGMEDISSSSPAMPAPTHEFLSSNGTLENITGECSAFLDDTAGMQAPTVDIRAADPAGVDAATPGPSSNCAELSSTPSGAAWKDKGRNMWHTLWKSHKKKAQRTLSRIIDSAVEPLEHRLDYVLTSGATGALVIRSVLVSHMAYWGDNDVAFFLLTRIFPELEEELCSDERREARKNRKRKHRDVSSPTDKMPESNNISPGLGQID